MGLRGDSSHCLFGFLHSWMAVGVDGCWDKVITEFLLLIVHYLPARQPAIKQTRP
jgi:hypothetical protein